MGNKQKHQNLKLKLELKEIQNNEKASNLLSE